mmetsp:Transcript_4177/g.9051  ORF Transcript_4177/g.9051 Transcript_4177/m.9051 type:complete len:269 (+) Transcript_4177:1301-2107(+)
MGKAAGGLPSLRGVRGRRRCAGRGGGGGGGGVANGRVERDVDDVVAIVRRCQLLAVGLVGRDGARAQPWRAARHRRQLADLAHRAVYAEGRDLDRHGEARAEALAQLRLVHDHDELLGEHLNHLFSQQRAAAALDQIELLVHRVRAVDGDVDVGVRVERRQRDAERARLLLRPHRRRHRHDVAQLATRELLPEPFDGVVGRAACSEADDHAVPHVRVDGAVSYLALELLLRGELGGRRLRRRRHALRAQDRVSHGGDGLGRVCALEDA